jgi:hypothetical protein
VVTGLPLLVVMGLIHQLDVMGLSQTVVMGLPLLVVMGLIHQLDVMEQIQIPILEAAGLRPREVMLHQVEESWVQ